jgi:hypothetical protein
MPPAVIGAASRGHVVQLRPAQSQSPVAVTAQGETAGVRHELERLGFRKAGAIRPLGGGRSCMCDVEDAKGFLVYAHVVGEKVMKCGITTPSLRSRVSQNTGTINQMIALTEGTARPAAWHERKLDRFKELAPAVIRAGQEIEIWVLESSEDLYRTVEQELNARFETMDKGWTSRLG